MKKTKYLLLIMLLALIALIFMPNTSNAAVSVEKNIYANNGSAKFNFSGLTLDKTHEYEFGMTKTAIAEVENWHSITVYTETTATIDISGGTDEFIKIILATDTGYITIKDKTSDTIVLQPYAVDLSIPYLNLTNYTVVNNGKNFSAGADYIQINFWNNSNSKAYYQYEKITDENVINKYKEIKKANGNYNNLQSLLKTSAPSSNWNTWGFWYSVGGIYRSGYGYTQSAVNMSENGLYYMWIYLAGNNVKNAYGYILVDNLADEIALTSISLPSTKEVELGKTLTLTPTFNPSNTTDKTVTWTSSDESVATVNNSGVVTPKKVGSTIITVTSNQGKKTAKCTVTVKNTSGSGTESSTSDGWTDASKASIKVIKETGGDVNFQYYYLSIDGITPSSAESNIYVYLTNGKNKPNLKTDENNIIKSEGYIVYSNGKKFIEQLKKYKLGVDEKGEGILEKNGDIYAWIVEERKIKNSTTKYENKFIVEGYKVSRPELNSLGNRMRVYINQKETSIFSHNPNNTSMKTNRKVKIKIGKVDNANILRAIKNKESGALNKLLEYSKSAKSIYTITCPIGKSSSIVSKLGIENKQYYYGYFELDDENGKYYPVEDVMLYQGVNDKNNQLLYNYLDSKFVWTLSDETPTKPSEDKTVASGTLPQTGETMIIIGSIAIITVIAVVAGIQIKKYKF